MSMPSTSPIRTALITGGNSGIGYECALELARVGLRVVIASRNRELSAQAVARIVHETGNDAVEEIGLDLGSLEAVRQCAKELSAHSSPLHVLVLNAGIQVNDGPRPSADGHELTFAVNHLGHFLLTHLLLEKLLASAPSRILVVASGVHDPAIRTGMPDPAIPDFESLARNGGPAGEFSGRVAYVNSKLCNLWFTYELVRRLEAADIGGDERPLSVNAFEPGLVPGSGLAREYPAAARWLWHNVLPALTIFHKSINTARHSGSALARLARDPALERTSGKYFPSHTRFLEGPSSEDSYNLERARELWEHSVRLTALTPQDSPLQSENARDAD